MSAILKFDFQKRKQLRFSEVNYLNYTKKTQFCMWHCGNYIFPKTRGNKNKQWTHSTPLKQPSRIQPQIDFLPSSGLQISSLVLQTDYITAKTVYKEHRTRSNLEPLYEHKPNLKEFLMT